MSPRAGALRADELKGAVVDVLRGIYDPEIPVNIYDLGLIYRLTATEDGDVEIEMTLTAPGCPVAQTFPAHVEAAVRSVPGVGEVQVRLVWDPPWSRDRLSEAAQMDLGIW